MKHICKSCGSEFDDKRKEAKYCKYQCYWDSLKGRSALRKEKILRQGYWYVRKLDHPFSQKQGYIAEHKLVMEKMIGRYLTPQEVVHHKNHIKTDNRPENLELFASRGIHSRDAHPENLAPYQIKTIHKKSCEQCGKEFEYTWETKRKKSCSELCKKKLFSSKMKGRPCKNPEALVKGRGWNKGLPMTWAPKGKDSPHYKTGEFSKYI